MLYGASQQAYIWLGGGRQLYSFLGNFALAVGKHNGLWLAMSTNPVPRRDEHVPLRPTFKSYVNYLKDAVKVTFRLHPDCGMRGARETGGLVWTTVAPIGRESGVLTGGEPYQDTAFLRRPSKTMVSLLYL
jgi:hypothetical protein